MIVFIDIWKKNWKNSYRLKQHKKQIPYVLQIVILKSNKLMNLFIELQMGVLQPPRNTIIKNKRTTILADKRTHLVSKELTRTYQKMILVLRSLW